MTKQKKRLRNQLAIAIEEANTVRQDIARMERDLLEFEFRALEELSENYQILFEHWVARFVSMHEIKLDYAPKKHKKLRRKTREVNGLYAKLYDDGLYHTWAAKKDFFECLEKSPEVIARQLSALQ